MNRENGVLVVGGGPAGCAAAIVSARAGAHVVLLERTTRAEPKVCGEFLSVEACEAISALGVDLEKLGAAPIDRVRIASDGVAVESRLPFRARSVSRAALDEALLNAALEAGVFVKRGATVLAAGDRDVRVRQEGQTVTLRAASVVLATGKTDVAGQRRDAARAFRALGFKLHLRLDDEQAAQLGTAVELSLVGRGYAGMQRIENGLVAFAAVVDQASFANSGSWQEFADQVSRADRRLAERLRNSREVWPKPLAVSGVPYGFVYHDRHSANNDGALYRAGDQLAVIPSFTGDGIAIALVSGAAAAEAIKAGESPQTFHAAMRKRLRIPMLVATTLSKAIRSPLGRAAVLQPARVAPQIIAAIAQSTRIAR